jgi:hypothetical protein
MISNVYPVTSTICPVPLSMLRRHAAVTNTYDDDLLTLYATVATEIAEKATNRYFLQRAVQWVVTPDTRQTVYFSMAVTLQNYFNTYQRPWLHLPHSAISVDSMAIGTWGVADTVLVEDQDYQLDLSTDPARVRMLSFAEFDPEVDHLTLNYTTGYAPAPTNITGSICYTIPAGVPLPICQAILLLTTRLREQRGDQDGGLWSCGAEALLAPYTVLQFGGSTDFYGS